MKTGQYDVNIREEVIDDQLTIEVDIRCQRDRMKLFLDVDQLEELGNYLFDKAEAHKYKEKRVLCGLSRISKSQTSSGHGTKIRKPLAEQKINRAQQ